MERKGTSLNYSEFTAMIGKKFGVDFFNCENDKKVLADLSTNHIKAKRGNYPTVYYFADVEGVNYIMLGDMDKSDGFEPVIVEALKLNNERPECEQYLINECPCWDALDEDTNTIYGSYGLTNCVEPATSDDEFIGIWVERHWEDGHTDMPANTFVPDDWYDNIKQPPLTLSLAQAYIDSLMSKPYELSPHEISRPTYIII